MKLEIEELVRAASAEGTARVTAGRSDIKSEVRGGSGLPKPGESTMGPTSAQDYAWGTAWKKQIGNLQPQAGAPHLEATSYVIYAWDTQLPALEVL